MTEKTTVNVTTRLSMTENDFWVIESTVNIYWPCFHNSKHCNTRKSFSVILNLVVMFTVVFFGQIQCCNVYSLLIWSSLFGHLDSVILISLIETGNSKWHNGKFNRLKMRSSEIKSLLLVFHFFPFNQILRKWE